MTQPPTQPEESDEQLRKIILDWQFFWMKQPDYRDRAFSIDANMRYHLADLIKEQLTHEKERSARLVAAIESADAMESWSDVRSALKEYERSTHEPSK